LISPRWPSFHREDGQAWFGNRSEMGM